MYGAGSVHRERDELMNTLTGQKAVLAEVRQREFEAYNQVKSSCHMVEQAQLEKAEVQSSFFMLWFESFNSAQCCVYNGDDHSLIRSFFRSSNIFLYEFSYIHFHFISSTGI